MQFSPDDMYVQFAFFPRVELALMHQRALLDGYDPNRQIGLILDEWGVWDQMIPQETEQRGSLWMQSTVRSAVAAGLGLNIFNRVADKLYMCNIAQIMNVLQSLLLSDGPTGEHCVRTTTYHAFALFKPHRSQRAVRVETESSSSPLGLSASASKGEKQLVLSLVNPRHDADLQVECTIVGSSARSGTAQILHDKDMNACNTFEQPDRVTPQSHPVQVNAAKVQVDLPRMSVATVVLQTG